VEVESTVKNPGVKGEGSPWGNFLRTKRAVVGKTFAGKLFAGEAKI